MQISSKVALHAWGDRLRLRGGEIAGRLKRPEALVYFIPAGLAGIAVQLWFHGGRFIAAGDVAPFIRTSSFFELESLWQHTFSGAGSPSFDMARLPELAVIRVVDLFGGSEVVAQRIFYTAIAIGVVLGATFLVRSFQGPMWLAGIAGIFAFFNPYLLVSFPNPLPAWTLACMAAIAGILIRVGKGRRVPIVAFVAVSLAWCYLVLNPPLLVVTCLWTVGSAVGTALLVDARGRARLRRFLLIAVPWALVANLWWIVAMFTWLVDSENSVAAVTDVQSWSWTHSRNSIPNVLSLSGHWGWTQGTYFPYSADLDRIPWGLFRFCIPLLALAAPFATRGVRRRMAWAGVSAAIVVIFLSKGLHEPLSSLNSLLYRYVPGMWLFRDPRSKFGPVLVLLFSILLFFTLSYVWRRARIQPQTRVQIVAGFLGGAVVLGLIYPYPMWTGAVIPDTRAVLPGAHVDVPDSWLRIASVLNRGEPRGKVLLLPINDYYQIPTTWGYYGSDRIPKTLLEAPTLQLMPGGYFGEDPRFRAMVTDIEGFLLDGDTEGAVRLLRALGVTHVVVRKDIDRSFSGRAFAPTQPLLDNLQESDGVEAVIDTKVASVYSVEDSGLFDSALTTVSGGRRLRPDQMSSLVASIPRHSAVYEAIDIDSVVVPLGETSASFEATWDRTQVSARLAARQLFASVQKVAGGFGLTLRRAPNVLVDGRPSDVGVVGRNTFKEKPVAIKVDDQAIALQGGAGLSLVPRGAGVEAYGRPAPGAPPVLSELHDCNTSDGRTMEEAGLQARGLPSQPAPAVELSAEAHSACVFVTPASFQRNVPYVIRLSHRTVQGRSARICLWQDGPNTCAKLRLQGSGRDWGDFEGLVLPSEDTERIRLFLYADGGTRRKTRIQYRDIDLRPLRILGHISVRKPHQTDIMNLEGFTTHEIEVRWPASKDALEPLSDVADCNARDELSPRQAGLSAEPLDLSGHSVRLRARKHSACVSSAILGFNNGALYRLEMEYRTLAGRTARLCVWQEDVGRCARGLPALEQARAWRTYTATLRPDPGATGLKLFVYADGGEDSDTITEYRGISMREVPPASVVLREVGEANADTAGLSWTRTGPSSYRATLDPRTSPSILIMNEAYSDQWQAEIVDGDESTELKHDRVNGYGNGWRVDPGGSVTLDISYGPDVWYRSAILISLIAIIAALLALVGPVLVRGSTLRKAGWPWSSLLRSRVKE